MDTTIKVVATPPELLSLLARHFPEIADEADLIPRSASGACNPRVLPLTSYCIRFYGLAKKENRSLIGKHSEHNRELPKAARHARMLWYTRC